MTNTQRMESKKLLVSFLTIVSILCLAVTISAAEIATVTDVKVDGVSALGNDISVDAGETITVKVYFTAIEHDSDVTVDAEIEGEKVDTDASTSSFDVEEGKSYRKTFNIQVPYELKDDLSDDVTLTIEIDGKDHKTELADITLRVQRPSYNADIKSLSVSDTVEAGETFPVDVVLKNLGYNDLEDVYVTASIPALGIKKTSYFGDIVALECDEDDTAEENYGVDISRGCDEDDENTMNGRLMLEVPYDTEAGIYTLEVEVTNDDDTNSVVTQIVIENDFAKNVIAASSSKTVAVGENAEYDLLIVNPTNKLKVYRVITESSGDLVSNTDNAVIAVPAGSSKTVGITASAIAEGEYNFDVTVLSGDSLVDSVTLNAKVEGNTQKLSASNPVAVLTVILAIVFLVLLIVLIVLIGKKPNKSEEFGESYY